MLQPLIEVLQNDLAQRFGFHPPDIEVVEARAVTWPDAGLGCPVPGMIYIQVPVDGALIRLRVGGNLFEYHSGGSRAPFLCTQSSAPAGEPGDVLLPPPGGGEGV